ncbi:MAG: AhpC/TSA family protein [Prevotella sp.]|nr:AhpC/TSA family protein [Prevotella sp.]
MKKFVFASLCVLLLASCQKGRNFTIEGTIEGAKDSTVYLYNRSLTGIVLLDSARLGSDGSFSFSAEAPVGGPDLYVLRLSSQWVNLSIDSTETVTLKAKWPGMAQNYTVSGSENCEQIRQLALMHSQLQQRVFAVEQDTRLLGQTMTDSLMHMLRQYKDSVIMNYIFREPQSAYAYFALSQTLSHLYWPASSVFAMSDSLDGRAYRAVATCWQQYYPQSERAQQLYNMVEREITSSRVAAARQQRILEEDKVVVSDLIDLNLPDVNGRRHTLSELRGQVVLLDFHLFSTPESGARILKLRELYDKYHARGLEVYQVSIDQDEHLWKQAVEALPWIAVYDPDGESCVRYNVQTLPEFFLIDRQNALQKRSSQMDDVEKEIQRLL